MHYSPLVIGDRAVNFQYWPFRRESQGWLDNPVLYTSHPWSLVQAEKHIAGDQNREFAAQDYVKQAQEFYEAGHRATLDGAQPLLFYYSVMNLTKAYIALRTNKPITGEFLHGLVVNNGHSADLADSTTMRVRTDQKAKVSVFGNLCKWLQPSSFRDDSQIPVSLICNQTLVGHRLWCRAQNCDENFERVRWVKWHESMTRDEKQIACLAFSFAGNRNVLTPEEQKNIQLEFGIPHGWNVAHSLSATDDGVSEHLVSREVVLDSARGINLVPTILRCSQEAATFLHRYVTRTGPLYRQYYFLRSRPYHLRLHGLVVAFALLYYLSSMTRYQPTKFRALISGRFGPFVRELVVSLPTQFLYLFTSELIECEVADALHR